ncbi:putative histone deacetylase [Venturia inaequalis]|nr:putative histone deacetylase [Venturia inaequalis]
MAPTACLHLGNTARSTMTADAGTQHGCQHGLPARVASSSRITGDICEDFLERKASERD